MGFPGCNEAPHADAGASGLLVMSPRFHTILIEDGQA